jgi:hypothetical protein
MYFVCNALGYRLMQLAAKRMGNEGHTFGAEAISLLLAIGYTFGVRKGRGRDTVRRDEKTKSVVKSVVQPTTNQPPPTHQTNQPVKKQNFRRAQGGSKESS